jgi:hypothetical protein
VDMYLLKLSIELKSQDIEIISSQGNYAFLKSIKDKLYTKNMYQKTGQRNLKSLEVHFSCQERVNFHMKIN